MIKRALESDTEKLKEIYDRLYEPGYVSFYFEHVYKPFNTYVIKQRNEIVATVSVNRHGTMINGKKLNVSYLTGFYVNNDVDSQELYKTMLAEVIEEMTYNDLITIIKAEDKDYYEGLGFEAVYQRKNYRITRDQLPFYSATGIIDGLSNIDMKEVYHNFTLHFDGYCHRDLDYYDLKQAWIDSCDYTLIGYVNKENTPEGYMILDERKSPVLIKEIVYLNSIALIKLLNRALSIRGAIKLSLPKELNIDRLIPQSTYEIEDHVYARINDIELFNRLYNTVISDVKQVFKLSKKPLYINEIF
jgi:predicted acetyltransferase